MKSIIVVDLGFGDSGKGTITDYLCRKHNASLVVRYNGGFQAAHTVVTDDGRQHTFHAFGSGTLAGVPTLIGPRVIVNPIVLHTEAQDLRNIGVLSPEQMLGLSGHNRVTTTYHTVANRIREKLRGNKKHGSCGLGIGETVNNPTRITVADILSKDLDVFATKLKTVRDGYQTELKDLIELVQNRGEVDAYFQSQIDLLYSKNEFEAQLELYPKIFGMYETSSLLVGGRDQSVIFEGAQGVLLDQDWGFHPHNTWTNTTTDWAGTGAASEEVIGVIRAYATRHGEGPFPTEYDSEHQVGDTNNPNNQWQGNFRTGSLDTVLLRYALRILGGVDSIAMTCADQMNDAFYCSSYQLGNTVIRDLPKTIVPNYNFQEKLGELLGQVKPNLTPVFGRGFEGAYIPAIEKELSTKISILSSGPAAKHKKEL